MDPDDFLVTCPFCGEHVEVYVEPDVTGSFVQDCEVCCNPWRVQVSGRGGLTFPVSQSSFNSNRSAWLGFISTLPNCYVAEAALAAAC
jgi:hypothetical protein